MKRFFAVMLLVVGGFGCGDDIDENGMNPTAECGNGVVETGEECDGDVQNGSCMACQIVCDTGFDDCNSLASDGCEAELNTEATCGSCSVTCSSAGNCTEESSSYICVAEQNFYPGSQNWDTSENPDTQIWFAQAVTLGAGTIKALGVYTDETTLLGNVKFALYEDSAGEPGNLLVATSSGAQTTGEFSLAVTETSISAGTYWIAMNADSTVSIFRFESDSSDDDNQTYYFLDSFANAASDPWPVATDTDYGNQNAYSFYVVMDANEFP